MDWMALDSAAALAILCHTLEELWDVEWRDSFSDNDNIIAYACDLDFLCNGCLSSSGTWEVLKEENSASVY